MKNHIIPHIDRLDFHSLYILPSTSVRMDTLKIIFIFKAFTTLFLTIYAVGIFAYTLAQAGSIVGLALQYAIKQDHFTSFLANFI